MISVVMATYNGEKFIEEQLQSIYDQTLEPDEVLIFDDRSTDGTVQIVRDFIEKNGLSGYWRLSINEKNKGFFRNFMDGAFTAHGDTIYFSDQDDIWDIHKIEKLEECLKQPGVMMARSNTVTINENSEIITGAEYIGEDRIRKLDIREMCKYPGPGFTMGLKRKVFEKIKKDNIDIDVFKYHDRLCGLMAVSMGKCVMVTDVHDMHRLHGSNQTGTISRSYVSDRTRDVQLDIVSRRKKYFRILAEVTDNTDKKKIFSHYSTFAAHRERYLRKYSINDMNWLIKHRMLYMSKVGVLSDTMYSLGMGRVVTKTADRFMRVR